MKNQILIFVLFILISCNNQKQTAENIKLELLNQKVFCSLDDLNKNEKSFANNEKGKNIILFKMTNNSQKDYLLVVNEDQLETFSIETLNSTSFLKKARMAFVIESSDNSKIENYTINGDSFKRVNKDCISFDPEINRMIDIKSKLKELDFPDIVDFEFSNSIRNNSFVLHPNETKYFKVILNLPIYDDELQSYGFLSYYKFDSKKNYSFKLEYISDSKTVNNKLPKYKKNEFEENQTEIFDGIIVSNKIPVVFR